MLASNRSVARRPVVLTTDCGADMDDQWALAHLALSPEIALRGVVTTHAPNLRAPAAETAACVAHEVLDRLPLADRPPVVVGANEPISDRTARPNAGAEFLLEQARGHGAGDRLVVLVIGAATDVAAALLADETVGDRIEIVAMAFDGWPDGGDVFNVRNDVTAWQVVIDSRAPVVVGDAAVTNRELSLSREGATALFGGDDEIGRYLVGLLHEWLDAHGELAAKVTGDAGRWPVWDAVVVAHLLGLTSSVTWPRPALRADLSFAHPAAGSDDGRTIEWITRIDAPRLWRHLRHHSERVQGIATAE